MNERVVINPDFRIEELRGQEAVIMGRIDEIAIGKVGNREVSLLPCEYVNIRSLQRVETPDGPILVENLP